jgi:hypothetical protein
MEEPLQGVNMGDDSDAQHPAFRQALIQDTGKPRNTQAFDYN